MGSRVDTTGVSTIARATLLSVDDSLGIDRDRGEGADVVHDVESISNSG